MSVSSSFVHGLSISVHPLKALLSKVRSTAAWGFPSWQTRSVIERRRSGFLNDSGNSFSGHSHTLQSRNRHMPSSGQKGQSHHNFTYKKFHPLVFSTEETWEGQQKWKRNAFSYQYSNIASSEIQLKHASHGFKYQSGLAGSTGNQPDDRSLLTTKSGLQKAGKKLGELVKKTVKISQFRVCLFLQNDQMTSLGWVKTLRGKSLWQALHDAHPWLPHQQLHDACTVVSTSDQWRTQHPRHT